MTSEVDLAETLIGMREAEAGFCCLGNCIARQSRIYLFLNCCTVNQSIDGRGQKHIKEYKATNVTVRVLLKVLANIETTRCNSLNHMSMMQPSLNLYADNDILYIYLNDRNANHSEHIHG